MYLLSTCRASLRRCLPAPYQSGKQFLGGLIIALLVFSPLSSAQNTALPDFGDSALSVLTPEKERLLGQQTLLKLRNRMDFSSDVITLSYLNHLTDELAQHAPRPLGEVSVYMVNNPTINAFALPGNHLAFYSGLLTHANSDAELASVIAHELAHQSQRHIPRMLERGKEKTLTTAAGLITGLLIGGQAGLATIASVNAASLSDQLAYNRGFEKEADATGIEILAAAGYPPSAMTDFFSQLESQARLAGSQAPEFLRTHPLSINRVAASRAKAASMQRTTDMAQPSSTKHTEFTLIQARTLALSTQNQNHTSANFINAQKSSEPLSRLRGVYGQTVQQLAQGTLANDPQTVQTAIIHIERASKNLPAGNIRSPLLDLLIAELHNHARQYTQAIKHLQSTRLATSSTGAYSLASTLMLARSYRLNDDAPAAVKTLRDYLRQIEHKTAQKAHIYPALSRAVAQTGDTTEATLLNAELQLMLGDSSRTQHTLAPLLKPPSTASDYHRARAKFLNTEASRLQAAVSAFKL